MRRCLPLHPAPRPVTRESEIQERAAERVPCKAGPGEECPSAPLRRSAGFQKRLQDTARPQQKRRRSRDAGGQTFHISLRHTPREMKRDKSAGDICKRASCPSRRESFCPRHFDEFAKTPRVCLGYRSAKWSNAVVAPAFVIIFRRGTLPGFHDQSLFLHSLDRPVKRTGTQFEFSMRSGSHILND